ncbi:MAG: hypothetical protein EXR79_01255 [Myxococcales bacterium]|nr:hypothetical protein [Myxococcales bacterium]
MDPSSPDPDPTAVSAVGLDALRRAAGLSVDREGWVCHEGERVAHPRLQRVLQEGLDVDAAGAAIVRFGRQWAFVACERSPFVVMRAHVGQSGLTLQLNTREAIDLPVDAVLLRLAGEHDLYVTIHDHRHEARFGRTAWMQAADWLDIDGDGGVAVRMGERRVKVDRDVPPR